MTSPLKNHNTDPNYLPTPVRRSLNYKGPYAVRDVTPIPVEAGSRYLIPLSHGYFAKVDAEDLHIVSEITWQSSIRKKTDVVYAICSGRFPDGKQTNILMHRLILGIAGKYDLDVDHIDRNALNNTRANLRLATRTQNNYNKRVMSTSKTGYKGVKFRPAKYLTYVHFDGKKIYGPECDDAVDAARERDRLAISLQGEYAYLNFPRSDYGDVPPYQKNDLRKKYWKRKLPT